jgi:long-chain acyl-CoA synthetase
MQHFSPYARFEQHARRQPRVEAIVRDGSSISYAELLDRVTSCANWMVHQGFVPGEVTGLCIRDEIGHLVCATALLCMGTPQMSLGAHEEGSTKRALVRKLGIAQLIVEESESADWMEGVGTIALPRGIWKGTTTTPEWGANRAFRECSVDSIALYQNTSGSTNVPKSFGVSLRRLLKVADRYAEDPRDRRTLRTGSVEFDAHRFQRITSLIAGNTCVYLRTVTLSNVVTLCERAAVTMIHMGSYKLASLLHSESRGCGKLPSFTNISTGGSRVPGSLRHKIKELLTENLWVQYATSEVGTISLATPDQHDRFPEGVGFPAEDVEVEILGPSGDVVEPGEIGQIRVRKQTMAGGYISEPGAGSSFSDGWFYPRDLVSRATGEPLIFHGRADDMMILNSINIFPSAIEDTLECHPDVQEAVAFAVKSQIHGEIPVAAVVLSANAENRDSGPLMDYCRQILGVRRPRRIFIVESIPRSVVGKPLRRELAKIHSSH